MTALCVALALLAGCGDAGGVARVTDPSTSSSVGSISPADASLGPGESLQLVARDHRGRETAATWASGDTKVASVSSSGRVTGRAAGTARITATWRTGSSSTTVDVITTATGAPVTTDGATFFVSPAGSDANAGTRGAPWKSIAFALPRLLPGQTLYVRGGTYLENVENPRIRAGRSDARIRVAAYPGERPVIQGLLWLTGASYWTLDGINVTWNPVNLPTDHMVRMTDGVGWVYENAELWGARSFAGLLVYGSVAGEPADWVIRGNCIHDIRTDPVHHVNGDHNLYINTGTSAGRGLIERNILFNAPNGQNIKLGYGRSDPQPGDGAANVTVRYNTMYGSLKNLLVADETHHVTVERNIIQAAEEGYAIRAFRLAGTQNVFRNNLFHGFTRLQYGDSGYGLMQDGGGNRFPLDPRFDGVGCGKFQPGNSTAQAYGRYAQ